MTPSITLFVTIDVEEDNWVPARSDLTLDNIRELPRLEAFFERLGIRATYLITYPVATQDWTVEIIRSIRDRGVAEIGAHLHPWNTPPLDEPAADRNTMVCNLPYELQLAKIACLTRAVRKVLGSPPTSFRAGRYGLGKETVQALARCGYRIDSSVTPFMNWERAGDGPNFDGAPVTLYWLGASAEPREPSDRGPLLEVPLSFGYGREPFAFWNRVERALDRLPSPKFHGLAARLGLVQKIGLNPEVSSVPEMLTLSRLLIERGVSHLQMSWHSPSLRPGLTPYTRTRADVQRLYSSIETYLEGLSRLATVRFANLRDAPALVPEPVPESRERLHSGADGRNPGPAGVIG